MLESGLDLYAELPDEYRDGFAKDGDEPTIRIEATQRLCNNFYDGDILDGATVPLRALIEEDIGSSPHESQREIWVDWLRGIADEIERGDPVDIASWNCRWGHEIVYSETAEEFLRSIPKPEPSSSA